MFQPNVDLAKRLGCRVGEKNKQFWVDFSSHGLNQFINITFVKVTELHKICRYPSIQGNTAF